MRRGLVALGVALAGACAASAEAPSSPSLECSALARVPATANCELETTTGYLKIGTDGKENNANGRTLYYTAVQAKGADAAKLVALVVAGDGPGLPLAHVENYKYLACHKGKGGVRYKVVVYDPVGVGQSELAGDAIDADHHAELLSVGYRGQEFQTVAEHFAMDRPFVAVGHGTGAATVVQCALDCGADAPQKMKSIVLASPILSCDDFVFNLKSYRIPTLPAFHADLLLNARVSDPLYPSAWAQYRSAFQCRIADPLPTCVADATSKLSKAVYGGMWGPDALTCTGTLARWADHKRIGEIRVPTYAFAMEHDTVDAAAVSKVFNGMAKGTVRGEMLPLGAHMAHVDAFVTWYSAMTAWLDGVSRAGEFVSVASAAGSPTTPGSGKPAPGAGAAAATVTVTADCTAPTATASAEHHAESDHHAAESSQACPQCHCPVTATDSVQGSIIPVIAGFFVASLVMTPVGYGLHALVHHLSKRGIGVFAQRPEDQYHTLTSLSGDEETIE